MKENSNSDIEKEAVFGIVPVLQSEKIYGFLDAFLILSGYCVATWSYTQGTYLTSLVGFKQLLIGAFIGALLMMVIYQIPVIMSVRYGIDIWIWFKSIFGTSGVKVITVIIILINFPWYAVCADLFSSSMTNLFALFGFNIPDSFHKFIGIGCVLLGTFIAYKGIGAITWTTRLLVPALLIVAVIVIIVGFTSVPFDVIWNYQPTRAEGTKNIIPYIISIEANFAFVITLIGGMGGVPRLTKKENSGYWASVFGQAFSGSLFVVVGAVMAIAMQYATGKMVDDPTLMLATLSTPAMALCSLLLVAFANIGTQAVGSYIYGVMLKSSFKKANYHVLITILAVYVGGLCLWGRIVEVFGPFLTITAAVYAPIASLLFVDFLFVRKQKLSLRSAFEVKGYKAYKYTNGFNWVGFVCVIAGVAISLLIYNPLTGEVHNMFFFHLTPTGSAFIGTGILYYILCNIPVIRKYVLRDRAEITV